MFSTLNQGPQLFQGFSFAVKTGCYWRMEGGDEAGPSAGVSVMAVSSCNVVMHGKIILLWGTRVIICCWAPWNSCSVHKTIHTFYVNNQTSSLLWCGYYNLIFSQVQPTINVDKDIIYCLFQEFVLGANKVNSYWTDCILSTNTHSNNNSINKLYNIKWRKNVLQ